MSITYRTARADDALPCAEIIRAWGDETDWMPKLGDLHPMAESWRDLLSTDAAWIAELDGKVAGFCVREEQTIVGLYVATAARGRGIGAQLLNKAKEDQRRILVWCYENNKAALRFYRREGLVELGREPDEEDNTGTLVYVVHHWLRQEHETE